MRAGPGNSLEVAAARQRHGVAGTAVVKLPKSREDPPCSTDGSAMPWIADTLCVSVVTVRSLCKSLYRKAGISKKLKHVHLVQQLRAREQGGFHGDRRRDARAH